MPTPNPLPAVLSGTDGDARAIIDTVKDLSQPQLLVIRSREGDAPERSVLVVPRGHEVKSLKPLLDEYRDKPERRKGKATLGDLASFIEHTNRFKDEGSVIFAKRSEDQPSVTSVLDYHPRSPDGSKARFGEHRGEYRFPTSEEWAAWKRIDGKGLTQADFAAWLEERIMDIQPPPATGAEGGALLQSLRETLKGEIAGPSRLLEVARGLKMTETSDVVNAQNLATGETEIVFRTQHQGVDGQPLKVPGLFVVGFPVFEGDAAYQMPIRLQYRRVEGRIIWTMKRYRPELVFFDAFDRALQQLREDTKLPVFIGTPEA